MFTMIICVVFSEVDDPWDYKYFVSLQTFHDIRLVITTFYQSA